MNPNDTTELQQIIDAAWEDRASLKPGTAPARIGDAVTHVLSELDAGTLRVAERVPGTQAWTTHQWIKKAVLLSFRLEENVLMENGPMRYFDKVPTKFAHYDTHKFQTGGFRVVPPAVAKRPDMRPAAKLDRIVAPLADNAAHRADAYLVAVLLAEHGHGAGLDRVLRRHQPGGAKPLPG